MHPTCQGCGKPLLESYDGVPSDRICDGCPCNHGRGINHGIVPTYVCTCDVCDPAQTGSVREKPVEAVKFREFL